MRLLVLAIAVLHASAAAAAAGSGSERHVASGISAMASLAPDGGTFQSFTDETLFDDAVGDPGALVHEGFEGGPTPPGGIDICNEPVSSASNDTCFSPGELVGGFQMRSSGGSGIVVLGSGFLGGNQTSTVIGANIYSESTVVTFLAPVIEVAADLYNGRSIAGSEVTVDAFDVYGNLLGSASVTPVSADTKAFLGLISSTAIARITITGANNGGEMVDNLGFGHGDSIFVDGFDGG